MAKGISRVFLLAGVCSLGCSAEGGQYTGGYPSGLGGNTGSAANNGNSGSTGGKSGGGTGGDQASQYFGDMLKPGGSSSSGNGEQSCGVQRYTLDRVPPELLVVQDRSGSMRRAPDGSKPSGGTLDKWTQITSGLNDVISSTQAQILWGLEMFPMPPVTEPYSDPAYKTDARKCQGDTPPQVAPALNTADAIAMSLAGAAPLLDTGATPTAAAIVTATAFFKADKQSNPKYLVLATDGLPNCKNGSDSMEDAAGAIAAVTAAREAGFPTFVVGIAVPAASGGDTLNALADAGGVPVKGGGDHYYSISNQAEFKAALSSIAGQVATCTFVLDKQPPDPNSVSVSIDGKLVPRSDTNGWSYGPGMTSVQLNGSACDSLKSGSAKNANIAFGCPGTPPPG